MKSLSLTQPVIIVVIGVPGAGKSFFARQFSDMFSVPLVSWDYTRVQVGLGSPQHTREETAVVTTLVEQQIIELLKTQKSFVVDGGCNARTDRLALKKLAEEAGYGMLVVWVQTDEPTSKQRATKRSSRRQGDAYNTSLSDSQFQTLSKALTAPSSQEPFVVISGKHTYATQAKIVLKKLVQPREDMARKPNAYSAQKYDEPQQPSVPPRRNVIIN